jgi:hypothetical protein
MVFPLPMLDPASPFHPSGPSSNPSDVDSCGFSQKRLFSSSGVNDSEIDEDYKDGDEEDGILHSEDEDVAMRVPHPEVCHIYAQCF